MTAPTPPAAECGCLIGTIHAYRCATVGHVDGPRFPHPTPPAVPDWLEAASIAARATASWTGQYACVCEDACADINGHREEWQLDEMRAALTAALPVLMGAAADAVEAERVELEKRLSGVPSWHHISGAFNAAERIVRAHGIETQPQPANVRGGRCGACRDLSHTHTYTGDCQSEVGRA